MAYQAVTVARLKESAYEGTLEAMKVANELGKKEQGCVYYNVFESVNSPFTTVTVEMWESEEDFRNHCNGKACTELGVVLDTALESVEVHEGECLF